MSFERDSHKSALNFKKHGVSFDEAKTIFSDEYARLIADPDNSGSEDRFVLLGASIDSKLLVICHCIRTEELVRIISARKASKQERKIYEDYRYA